jgi:glyoxylase-like metal-dependent hydrolase (beta-lactamase superfamily II)
MNQITFFRYHNTNCFFIRNIDNDNFMAFDAGWPCTLYEYQRNMKQIGIRFKNIKWAIISHFHLDHAGLISEFIDSNLPLMRIDDPG